MLLLLTELFAFPLSICLSCIQKKKKMSLYQTNRRAFEITRCYPHSYTQQNYAYQVNCNSIPIVYVWAKSHKSRLRWHADAHALPMGRQGGRYREETKPVRVRGDVTDAPFQLFVYSPRSRQVRFSLNICIHARVDNYNQFCIRTASRSRRTCRSGPRRHSRLFAFLWYTNEPTAASVAVQLSDSFRGGRRGSVMQYRKFPFIKKIRNNRVSWAAVVH